jgi:hypothetical protein
MASLSTHETFMSDIHSTEQWTECTFRLGSSRQRNTMDTAELKYYILCMTIIYQLRSISWCPLHLPKVISSMSEICYKQEIEVCKRWRSKKAHLWQRPKLYNLVNISNGSSDQWFVRLFKFRYFLLCRGSFCLLNFSNMQLSCQYLDIHGNNQVCLNQLSVFGK